MQSKTFFQEVNNNPLKPCTKKTVWIQRYGLYETLIGHKNPAVFRLCIYVCMCVLCRPWYVGMHITRTYGQLEVHVHVPQACDLDLRVAAVKSTCAMSS